MTAIGSLRALRARLTYGENLATSCDPAFAEKGRALIASIKPKIEQLVAAHPELETVASKPRRSASSGTGKRGARGSLAALRAHLTRTTAKRDTAPSAALKAEHGARAKEIQAEIDNLVKANPGIEVPKERPGRAKGEAETHEVDRQAWLDLHEKKADKLAAAMARLGLKDSDEAEADDQPVKVKMKQRKAA
jgi:hypothetical protein